MLEQAKSVDKGFIDTPKIEEKKKTEEPPLKKAKMSDWSPSNSYQPETEDSNRVGINEKMFMMEEIDNSMNLEVEELSMVLLKEESFSDTEETNGHVKQDEAEKIQLVPEERKEEDGDFAETDCVLAPSKNIPEEGFSDVEESPSKVLQTEPEKIKDVLNEAGDVDGNPLKLAKSCPNLLKGLEFILFSSHFFYLSFVNISIIYDCSGFSRTILTIDVAHSLHLPLLSTGLHEIWIPTSSR